MSAATAGIKWHQDDTKKRQARYASGVSTTSKTKINQRINSFGCVAPPKSGADGTSRTFTGSLAVGLAGMAITAAASGRASVKGGSTVDVFGTRICCRHVLHMTVIPLNKSGEEWIAWQPGHE
jgi:hypothetical protein